MRHILYIIFHPGELLWFSILSESKQKCFIGRLSTGKVAVAHVCGASYSAHVFNHGCSYHVESEPSQTLMLASQVGFYWVSEAARLCIQFASNIAMQMTSILGPLHMQRHPNSSPTLRPAPSEEQNSITSLAPAIAASVARGQMGKHTL